MSCYKELICEVEELREQLTEVLLAVESLRDLAAESDKWVDARNVWLLLSGVPKSAPLCTKVPPTLEIPSAPW
jgi:hypothetical protein